MENQDWLSYKIEVRNRLKRFVLDILKLSEMIPGTTGGKVINYQLTKSGTSVYANFGQRSVEGRRQSFSASYRSRWKKPTKPNFGSTC